MVDLGAQVALQPEPERGHRDEHHEVGQERVHPSPPRNDSRPLGWNGAAERSLSHAIANSATRC